MRSFKELVGNLTRHLQMMLGGRHTTKALIDDIVQQIRNEVAKSEHGQADIEYLELLLGVIELEDTSRVAEAIALIAASNNFDCMKLAIECDSAQGKFCADRLMAVAREHLKLCGHIDRAQWARKRLLLAKRWYAQSETLSEPLAQEIENGLKATRWVLACKD